MGEDKWGNLFFKYGIPLLIVSYLILFSYETIYSEDYSNTEVRGYFETMCRNNGQELVNYTLDYQNEGRISGVQNYFIVCCEDSDSIKCWNDVEERTISIGPKPPYIFINKN